MFFYLLIPKALLHLTPETIEAERERLSNVTKVTQLVSWNSSQPWLASCRLSAGPSHAEVLFGALVAFVVLFCCPGGWGSGWLGLALRMIGPRRYGFPLLGPGSQLTPHQRHLNRLVQCLSNQATMGERVQEGSVFEPRHHAILLP